MPAKKQKEFSWEKGSVLEQDDYEPLGKVREMGFTKLADGILADPIQRKEARKAKLTRAKPQKAGELFIEESHSGLKEDFTPTNASKILGRDSKGFKGIGRFSKPAPSSKKTK